MPLILWAECRPQPTDAPAAAELGLSPAWSSVVRLSKMKFFYPLGMIAAALFSAFACYGSLFFGWLSATPLTDGQRARAEYDAKAWFAIFVACWVVVFALGILWIRSHRKRSGDLGGDSGDAKAGGQAG